MSKKYKPINLRKKKNPPYVLAILGLVGIAWACSGDEIAGQKIERVTPLQIADLIEQAERDLAKHEEGKPVELFKPASHVKLRKAKKPVDTKEIADMTLLLYGTDAEAKAAQERLSKGF